MRIRQITITCLLTAVLSAAWLQSASASEAETAADNQTESSSEDTADLKVKPINLASTDEKRPAYKALDYVPISNEDYKSITFSAYPPADDSEAAQTAYQTMVDTNIMTQLYQLYPVKSYPDGMLSYIENGLKNTYEQYAQLYGMSLNSFLQTYLKLDTGTFREQVKEAAKKTLTQELLLRAVAEKENITVSDSEYEKGLSDYASAYGYESADALKKDYDEDTIRVSLLMDKTIRFLEQNAKIVTILETETETETLTETELSAQQ